MYKIILTVVLSLVSGLALTGLSGCGDDGICENDQNCVLSGDKTYSHTCENASGCNYHCTDGATCHLSCPKGNCRVVGDNAAEVVLDCSGDNCSLQCTSTATCAIEGCSAGCDLQCTAAQSCTNSCDETSGCATVDSGAIDF